MQTYAEAKARIFHNQTSRDFAVVPARDPWLERHKGVIPGRVLRFGTSQDEEPDVCLKEGSIVYRQPDSRTEESYETGRVMVPGKHNLENMMSALAAARLCGADPRGIQRTMDTFAGLEHRVEYVGEARGTRFFNDSKATTVDSVVRALECFEDPVLLLAGGKDKGGPFAPLQEPVGRIVRRLFLYGAAAGRMTRELAGATEIETAGDLEGALAQAWHAARPGEVILLSPACSSFDMFQDYEDRGRRFKALVHGIVQDNEPAR
jgi:UDP-N-acetylmuramoylalanine--D-glutamate ligase